MAISLAQQTQNITTSSGSITAFAANTTTGNMIIAIVTLGNQSFQITGVSDGRNTYKKLLAGGYNGSTYSEIWYALNITGATTPTVTAIISGTTAVPAINLLEIAGCDITQPIDYLCITNFLGTTTTTNYPITTPELKAANEFVLVYACTGGNTGTWTVPGTLSNSQTQAGTSLLNIVNASTVVSSQAALSYDITKNANFSGFVFILTLANVTMPGNYLPTAPIQNFLFPKAPDPTGNAVMSVTEKIR